ncbi:hypothetical protein HNY73_002604 [Argiope bruennichi]|uniref:Uncharacterized protein n=1 Tax=Argiope bruennichi TaxID=94029 RepID=A0A8T0FU67_ARGBR|nr:hypothetical protein HNY73_002604 [Argiope bruennichi]
MTSRKLPPRASLPNDKDLAKTTPSGVSVLAGYSHICMRKQQQSNYIVKLNLSAPFLLIIERGLSIPGPNNNADEATQSNRNCPANISSMSLQIERVTKSTEKYSGYLIVLQTTS